MQLAGNECRVEYCIRYYSCLIPVNHSLRDTIVFLRGSAALGSERAVEFFRKRIEPARQSSDENGRMKNSSGMRLDCEKSESELFAFMVETPNVLRTASALITVEIKQSG